MGKYRIFIQAVDESDWLTAGEYRSQVCAVEGKMKALRRIYQKKCRDGQKERLVNHMSSEPTDKTEENPAQQNSYVMKTTDEFDAHLQNCNRLTNVPILKESPTEAKYFQSLIDAAEQLKEWENLNGIKPNGYRHSTEYFLSRIEEHLMTVEMFVNANFPALPPNSLKSTEEYLNDTLSVIFSMMIDTVQCIGDSVLEKYLLDSFNRQLFGTLRLLVDRNSTVKDSSFFLQWMKKTYFSDGLKGCLSSQKDVLSVTDPLLLADWLIYLKQKHLKLLQDKISTTLDNILQHAANTGSCNDRNEEAFIQVQLDVIQCLNASIKTNEIISHTLKNAVQRLCCDEFHRFIKRYVNAERADETNLLCHFKRLYTCRQLRFYAMRIMDKNNDTDSATLLMLTNTETQCLSSAQRCFEKVAMENLKKYFNKEENQFQNMIVTILKMLTNLPQVEQGTETKQFIEKSAYHSVTKAYLQCLTQSKYKHLEKRWGDVEKKIMSDAEHLHLKFANQNGSDDEQKMLLLTVGEMLQCRDVDALKLLCSNLYSWFPKESEEHIRPLLHWRGMLSRQKIDELIDIGRNVVDDTRNRDHVTSHPKICLCCCFL